VSDNPQETVGPFFALINARLMTATPAAVEGVDEA